MFVKVLPPDVIFILPGRLNWRRELRIIENMLILMRLQKEILLQVKACISLMLRNNVR